MDCGASQDKDGKWVQYDDGFGAKDVRIGRSLTFLDPEGVSRRGLVTSAERVDGVYRGLTVLVKEEDCTYGGIKWDGSAWKMAPYTVSL